MKYGNNRALMVQAMSLCAEDLRGLIGHGLSECESHELHFKPGLGDKFLFNRMLDSIADDEFWMLAPYSHDAGRGINIMKNTFYGRFFGD